MAEDGNSKRGLASASPETRQRVVKEGDKASKGGGRSQTSEDSGSNE